MIQTCKHPQGLTVQLRGGQGTVICVDCGVIPIGTVRWTNVK